MSLPIKYRPKSFSEVVGNKNTVRLIQSKLDNPPSAFLLTGPPGIGKTTLGRIIGIELGCYNPDSKTNMDFIEYNSADFRGIDTIRQIRESMYMLPNKADMKIYLLDELHQLSRDAQESLLKPLEEPPDHVLFILCTTNPEKLTEALKRRCCTCSLLALSEKEIVSQLRFIVGRENKKFSDELLNILAERSNGSLGIAVQRLDEIIDFSDSDAIAFLGKTQDIQYKIKDLCQILIKGHFKWEQIRKILVDLQDEQPENIRRAVLGYCNAVLLKNDSPNAGLILSSFANSNTYDIGKIAITNILYELCTILNS
jgi:DNA polymerase III subunit gamma/tau